MELPCLPSCDVLVFGSHEGAMALALTLTKKGQQVLLASSSTCLFDVQCRTGDWRVPMDTPAPWDTLFYPPHTLDDNGLLHPDRLKQHGEALLADRRVQLLYAMQLLGWQNGFALLAHKSGLYAVRCSAVYDCTRAYTFTADSYCLHIMEGSQHRQLLLSSHCLEDSPRAQFDRYQAALEQLPAGATLARSGVDACCRAGYSPRHCIELCLAMEPIHPGYTPCTQVLQADNPIHRRYTQQGLPVPAPVEDQCDVLVVGGGTAGAAAALFSARTGLKTRLIEMNRMLGGTATIGGVSSYWFGCRGGATAIIDRAVQACCEKHHLPRKAGIWAYDDAFPPDVKAHVLLGLCLEAGVDIRFSCVACAAERSGQRVTGVYYAHRGQPTLTRAGMILDCTGDGDICMLAGAGHVYGSDADGMTYWGSLAQFVAPDRYKNNFSTMVHVGDPLDYTRFIIAGRRLGPSTYDHGQYVAVRESRHIRGMETITLADIVTMRPVDDPLYTCFSNYDPKGRLTAAMCYFGLLPPNQMIPIPRGAVIPTDAAEHPLSGLLVGGKAISCTHDALPALRMQPDLQAQGLALAALAWCSLTQDVPAWKAQGVCAQILRMGGDRPQAPAGKQLPLADAIASLTGSEPWHWLDAPADSYATEVPVIIRVMAAPSAQAVPLLTQRLHAAHVPQLRLLLSRLLLWHHAQEGAAEVIAEIRRMLHEVSGLPRRTDSINYGQMLPDHGLMPEAVYLINTLAHAQHPAVLPLMGEILARLECARRDWFDLRAGIYCYCESFAFLALHNDCKGFAPLLRRLLALPEFQQEPDSALLSERLQMLRITLLHALHHLGYEDGTQGLRACTQDRRLTLALAAEKLLN